ncbi:MAG: hypothetical protein ACD_72C00269G0002 [uncultured bacterium]|nr:MAG: hypothetical protein ACD_72C00269G0002 [uncultured bacterium]
MVKIPPPSRAKIEISDDPKEKPINGLIALIKGSPSPKMFNMTTKNPVTPNRPKPTTNNPVTVLARKATLNDSFRPTRAASVVRTLARTEMFIPINPAIPDKTAPTAKAKAILQPRINPKTKNNTIPTTLIAVYCLRKYADAPC